MKWYATCHVGTEPMLAKELAFLGVEAKEIPGGCAFSCEKEVAAGILWRSQVANRLLLAVYDGPFEELNVKDAQSVIPADATFRVTVTIKAGSVVDAGTLELEETLGQGVERKVSLKNPDYDVFVQVAGTVICGIDIAGDLSKRYYRVFTNSRSIKGTLAASLIWLLPDPHTSIVDPFANTGEIAIEAGLSTSQVSPLKYRRHQKLTVLEDQKSIWDAPSEPLNHNVWCFDQTLGNIRSAKKNAKLAGVEKAITFSKIDPEWLDYKFDEKQVSALVTVPPPVTKRKPSNTHIKELFYQAKYVLGEKASLIIACTTPETAQACAEFASKQGFSIQEEHIFYSGMLPLQVIRYEL